MLFAFFVTSDRDSAKFLKIISQSVLVKLQTDTVFTKSLSSSYDDLLISRNFFRNTTQCPEFFSKHLCQTLYFNTVAISRPATC